MAADRSYADGLVELLVDGRWPKGHLNKGFEGFFPSDLEVNHPSVEEGEIIAPLAGS